MKQIIVFATCLFFTTSPSLVFSMDEQVETQQQDKAELCFLNNAQTSDLPRTARQYIDDALYWFPKIQKDTMGISGKREAIIEKVKYDAQNIIPNYSTNEKLRSLIWKLDAEKQYLTNDKFCKKIVNIYNVMGDILERRGAPHHILRNFSIIFAVTVILVVLCLFGSRYIISENEKISRIMACEKVNTRMQNNVTIEREYPQQIYMTEDTLSRLVKIYTERSDFNYPNICQVATKDNITFVAKLDNINRSTLYLSFKQKVTARIVAINAMISHGEWKASWYYLDPIK